MEFGRDLCISTRINIEDAHIFNTFSRFLVLVMLSFSIRNIAICYDIGRSSDVLVVCMKGKKGFAASEIS